MSNLTAVLDRVRDTPLHEIPASAVDLVVQRVARQAAADEAKPVRVARFGSAI